MKRLIFVLSVFVMTVFTTMTICRAVTYDVIQLSEGSGDASSPRINDSGHVVWEKNSNIYLYDGTTTTKISTGSSHGFSPDINNAGTVVWYSPNYLDKRFHVFNGFSITSIDVPYGIGSPQINNQGQFAWIGIGLDELDYEIFLYEGANIIQITDNAYDDIAFDINDNGIVVWSGGDGSDDELFVYDGTGITQFTDNFNHDVTPRINNAGQIAWNRDDSVTWHYFLYDGVSTFQLSTTEYISWGGDINDHGMVVWYGADVYQDFKIFVYDGTTTVLSNPPYNVDVRNLRINNRGQVVWSAGNGGEHEIFLYDGSAIIQLTDNDYRDLWPEINDLGHVTWRGEVGDWEVFLAVPNRAEMMEDIVSFFDSGLANKTIRTKVPKWVRDTGDRTEIRKTRRRRKRRMQILLNKAEELIATGFTNAACGLLEAAFTRCDGQKIKPKDWFKGEDVPELASMIQDLMDQLRCL